jgi:hypothetical protein
MVIEAIIIAGIVAGVALLGYIVKVIAQSKCDQCSFLGIKVHRNTQQEPQEVKSFKFPKIM